MDGRLPQRHAARFVALSHANRHGDARRGLLPFHATG